jgi:hypothetical protein
MNRIRPTPAPKALKMCYCCDPVAEHYAGRAECCRCYNQKQKRYRAEYGSVKPVREWQQRHAEYQRTYQSAYYAENKERIQAQRKAVRCE